VRLGSNLNTPFYKGPAGPATQVSCQSIQYDGTLVVSEKWNYVIGSLVNQNNANCKDTWVMGTSILGPHTVTESCSSSISIVRCTDWFSSFDFSMVISPDSS